MNILKYIALAIISTAFLSCSDDAIEQDRNDKEADAHTRKVTQFIYDQMSAYYLWNTQIPQFDLRYEKDPVNYFLNIITQQDYDNEWSYITDQAQTKAGNRETPAPTFGYFLSRAPYDEISKDVFGIILYIFPNTPAEKAGLKRGDIITEVNGEFLTEDNFNQLFENANINVTLAKLVNGQLITDKKVYLQPERVALNPVNPKIIDNNGQKVGYLIYTDFISDYNNDLDLAFEEFKNAGVSDIVLDLRYNFGGDDKAFSYLCSSIAPQNTVNKENIIITNEWNSLMKEYFTQQQMIEECNIRFNKQVKTNLNLNRIYILTSSVTSSAAEATLLGLFPYMQVNHIGEQTAGHYLSSLGIQAGQYKGDVFIPDSEIGNWYIEPVVAQYKNVSGTIMTEGLIPTTAIDDIQGFPLVELGNINEPMLKEALQLINGGSSSPKLKTRSTQPFAKISGRYVSPTERVTRTLRLTQFKQK